MDFNDRIERLADRENKASKGLIRLSRGVLIRSEALPLLREMAQALSEAQAENERLSARVDEAKKLLLKTELRPGSMFVALFETLCGERKELEALHDA